MRKLTILSFFILFLASCEKDSESLKIGDGGECVTGKIVAKGCHGNAIVEIINPREPFLKQSVYSTGDNQPLLEYVISTNVPVDANYSIGDLIYFTIKDFGEIGVRTSECIWPKYAAEIEGISKNSCDSLTSK